MNALNQARTRLTLPLAGLMMATLALAGCELVEGESGLLNFDDTTTGGSLNQEIGAGATIIVRTSCIGCPNHIVTQAESLTPDVLEVVDFADDTVTLRTLRAGEGQFRVAIGGTSDTLSVTVTEIADATIRLEPWDDIAPLPRELWTSGFAMIGGSTIDIRAFSKDAAGNRLTGFGGITWEADNGGTIRPTDNRRDDRVVLTAPTQPREMIVTPSAGPAQTIQVVNEADVASVELAIIGSDGVTTVSDGGTFSVDTASSLILHLVARTADGTYVSGPGETLAEMTFDTALDGLVTDTLETLAAEEADQAALDALRRAYDRGFLLSAAETTGTGTATFTWGEHTLSATLTVTQAPAEGE